MALNNKLILFYSSSFPELSQEEEPQKRDVKSGTAEPKKCDVISDSSSQQEKPRGKPKKKGKKDDVISDEQDKRRIE